MLYNPMRKLLRLPAVLSLGCLLVNCGSNAPSNSAVTTVPAKLDFGEARVSPKAGSGREGRFRVSLTPRPGGLKPAVVGLLINDRQNGENACYVFRSLALKVSMLVPDSGLGSTGLGESESVGNRQCELLREGTSSTSSDSEVTADFHIRFRPEFRGARHLWVIGQDEQGHGVEFQAVGDWTVE